LRDHCRAAQQNYLTVPAITVLDLPLPARATSKEQSLRRGLGATVPVLAVADEWPWELSVE
jgi:hypothetical protein